MPRDPNKRPLSRTRRRILRVLRRGVALRPERLELGPPIDASLQESLLRYRPVVIAHRAGNHARSLRLAVESGAGVCEIDVRPRGGALSIGHEHWFGPVAYDFSQRLLRLQPRSVPLPRLLREAASLDCILMIDLKFRSLAPVPVLLKELRAYGLEDRAWFTGQWPALDAVGAAAGERTPRYYGVNRLRSLRRFLAQQPRARRSGISLNRRLASPSTIATLHGAGVEVFVYTISSPEQALTALEAGADGLITHNLSLIELFAQRQG